MAIVYNSNMTGDELKSIYKLSKLKADPFAALISDQLKLQGRTESFERHHLYTQFSRMNKPVDYEIEKAVKAIPDLAKQQMLLQITPENSPQIEKSGPTVELLEKAMDMMYETMNMLKESYRIIQDDNTFIKEDASIYRSIVQQGMKEGIVKFVPPKVKA